MRRSLRKRLTSAFIGLAVGPLLLVGIVLAGQSFFTQQQQALQLQREVAQRVATQITAFFTELENELRIVNEVQGLQTLDLEKQRNTLSELLFYQDVFEELTLLDNQGQEQIHLGRVSSFYTLGQRAEADEFVIPKTTGETYYSPVRFKETTGEPLMIIAVPLLDVRTGQVGGALVADVRLKKIWDLIATVRVDDGQSVYIVDAQNKVVAHRNPSLVLQETNFEVPTYDGIQSGLNDNNAGSTGNTLSNQILGWLVQSFTDGDVVLAVEKVQLGQQEFNVIAQQTVLEALALAINAVLVTLGLLLVALVVSGTLGFLIVGQVIQPIQTLATTARDISAGDLSKQVLITRDDELGILASAFNSMTGQLSALINSLEERVADRTQRLEIVATLGERLNTILDPADLLQEVVNQVKQNFGYYHTHIYLLDETRENLVVTAGTGSAGQEMVTKGHHISMDAAKSLVATAARSRKIVATADVQAAEDWLPNPLLPETRSEMTVPIMKENEVIGVLDVQADRVAGLDESDASLLRSVANQVAVALANARLFKQTLQSKEEAEQAQKETEAAKQALEIQMWQTAGQAHLNDKLRGEQDISTLANNVIQQLCKYLNATMGTLYVSEDQKLQLAGSYAYTPSRLSAAQFHWGEGLIGQAALEKQPIVIDAPSEHITVTSSLGDIHLKQLLVAPFVYDGQVGGVIELAGLAEFSPAQIEFLNKALENVAITFTTAQARHRVNELLFETQQQAETLQSQEEELRAANEELASQTESLLASEARLKAKQVELQEVNVKLEEKAEALQKNSLVLQEQQGALDQQNQQLKTAQQALEQKAEELALASKYKSEFLANMSHELRTPLNSLLILAGMLSKNETGNLTDDQVESVQIIHKGGTDLLNLINEILDLSKIEAGRMEFHFGPVTPEQLLATMRAQFMAIAESKGLAFEITLAEDVPAAIETDQQRVEQIIKNLLSNAFKFTAQGSVRLAIHRPQPDDNPGRNRMNLEHTVAISVTDSGIGMTPEQQKIVFEAFQQADGSTSRQYGGTGLGLTISRELALKLGGQLGLVSVKGQGSTFTLYLPITRAAAPAPVADQPVRAGSNDSHKRGPKFPPPALARPVAPPLPSAPVLADDREAWREGDRLLLIIEDDFRFARAVYDYAHKKEFKCLLAGDGEIGLQLAQNYPVDAIILDLKLPGISGWDVLERLKDHSNTRHIPVHIMSAADENLEAYKRGAMGFLAKPIGPEELENSFQKIENFIDRKIKNLLLVEDDANLRKSVRKLLEGNDVIISEASLGEAALAQLTSQHFDCMILDLSLPDMSGFELLNRLDADDHLSKCPVIIYTGKALTEAENHELLKYADSVIIKGVKSPERLLDETALFLHRVIANLPEEKQRTIRQLHDSEAILANKTILIVDDDARNAFALSKLLNTKGLSVYIAPTGQKALEWLDKTVIDLVLMDIMMPEMDGYETTRRIRTEPRFRNLPILALTAKAMQGDREKCLAAGANDYLSKPIDPNRLFSMLRVWLSRE